MVGEIAIRTVRVHYHNEDDQWWAESPDLPGYSAAGASFIECQEQVYDGLPYFLEAPVSIDEDGVPELVAAFAGTDLRAEFAPLTTVASGTDWHINLLGPPVDDSGPEPLETNLLLSEPGSLAG